MPTSTFMNLSSEKKEKILSASIVEFADKPFSEVSINKIIKNAKISRGSFYTYFADKYDLLMYLLERFKDIMEKYVINLDASIKSDLEELILSIHSYIYSLYENSIYQKFFFNIISYFHTHQDEETKNNRDKLPFINDCNKIYNVLDLSQFSFKDEKRIKQVIEIALSLIKNTLYDTAINGLTYEKSKNLLKDYLEILKHGYKEESNA